MHTKDKIIRILQQTGNTACSGERIAEQLGVSRVSVWKQIQNLISDGYDIQTTPKGYCLTTLPDTLFPWEFPSRENQIHYFRELPSTMSVAGDLARKNCPSLTVVVADRQSKGRGRLSRQWVSESGGLYFTVVTRPEIAPRDAFRVNFAAATTLADVLRNEFKIHAGVKWPNDILVDGRKICGMLSEMSAEGERISYVNIGIGINVNNPPPETTPSAVSMRQLTGRDVRRKSVLAAFLETFERRLDADSLGSVIAEWKKRNTTLGKTVSIVTVREQFSGLATDVDEDGALIITLADGSCRKILYGDCFHDM